MLKGFRVLRGNVIDLAVAVVIGAALVDYPIVNNVFNELIGALYFKASSLSPWSSAARTSSSARCWVR